jgi:hypothetical protein
MLRFNRILAALAEWINALVWWREGKARVKPYILLDQYRIEGAGILHFVKRNPDLCPRDVGTFIWLPLRSSTQTPPDIHICIDHLEGFSRKRKFHTHQITIAAASHWPDEDGLFEYEPIYSATADLQGMQSRRDLHVRRILANLIQPLTHGDNPYRTNWESQLHISMKDCGLDTPKIHGIVTAHGYDRDRDVNVNY